MKEKYQSLLPEFKARVKSDFFESDTFYKEHVFKEIDNFLESNESSELEKRFFCF